MTLVCVLDFSHCPCPGRGEGRGGGRESGRGVRGWRGAGSFLSKGSFDLVGVGGGRAAAGLGDGRSITFVGTQCLSKVKSDLAFLR
jgi:hypothetical protein